MSFEEELNKILEADDLAYEHIIKIKNEYCLDKHRVLSAIEELTLTGYRGNPEGYIDARLLKEKLGIGGKE